MKRAALIVGLALAACSPPTPQVEPRAAPAAPMPASPAPPPSAANSPANSPANSTANPPGSAAEDPCNRAAYADIVGRSEKDPTVPPAGPRVRRIHPGDQVTMDYRADRLDIDIDAKGVITGLRCG